jgi:carboxyl-terminal processing protease
VSAIRLTTARYYPPNGRSIQATGITPDIVMETVTVAAGGDGKRDEIRERNLPRHLEQGAPDEGGEDGGMPEGETSAEGEADPQLDRAVELLKSWNVFRTVVAHK